MENYYTVGPYIAHNGVKGMKWGIRRYQNADGSLTEVGKKRYGRDAREKGWTMGDDGIARSGGKKNRKEETADPNRWVKEDLSRSKNLTEAGSRMTNELKKANDSAIKNKPRTKMDLSNMTDQEMREKINRAFLEKQYNDMFNPPQVSKGREYANKILETSGSVLGVTGSALGIALAIKELRG